MRTTVAIHANVHDELVFDDCLGARRTADPDKAGAEQQHHPTEKDRVVQADAVIALVAGVTASTAAVRMLAMSNNEKPRCLPTIANKTTLSAEAFASRYCAKRKVRRAEAPNMKVRARACSGRTDIPSTAPHRPDRRARGDWSRRVQGRVDADIDFMTDLHDARPS